jgi:hypothetical protein
MVFKMLDIRYRILNVRYQYLYNDTFSKNRSSDYISAIQGSRAPKFWRMIDYFKEFVNNLVRTQKVIYF